ncbi:MAG: hypothetical protein ABIM89_08665 [Mycobacteriales bacterium]
MTRRRAPWLSLLAADADVPVFVARGLGTAGAAAQLRSAPRLRVVDSPRAATVLLVVGQIPDAMLPALRQVHDQLASPRATVWWTGGDGDAIAASWPQAVVVDATGDVEAAIVAAHRGLISGTKRTEPPLLPDVDPVEWRGVGPYGHGGTGMTGGVPFGRPLAGRGDDLRDGLSLDVVPVWVGPFFPPFPAGLALKVTFAGDVVHAVEVGAYPDAGSHGLGGPLPDDVDSAFTDLAREPVTVARLELARAHHHLRWLTLLLHLYGLDALGLRVAGMNRALTPDRAPDVVALARRLDKPWVLKRSTAGVGSIGTEAAAQWGGPIARAAGISVDARTELAAYRGLNFTPLVHTAGDARDRWRQRLAETVQSLELAGRAGDATLEPGTQTEPPSPPPPAKLDTLLPSLLTGAEWGDAVASVVSLDLDFDAHLSREPEPVA